ncbi:DUF3027 domain-containing protein [Actinacidiphila bryophytorum]|uniref:DUF3027 domain-containing protein n=1 Tax=Actinacidiphila bryophytorum TaxID=1436133 RepID=A0A9W4H0T7_9ACTN|nr:DUF3027 domain-containing protein [Actinacidiphila bryophytorum]MBM9439446.1 DUF3027 domain-containing protein [Actinacidiphila bryophytorum]MBN6545732.1 DUF3027 domain-containing protein [Actinacidiphila bryophytorum]CAG7639482.1 conserved hypothetical protein [Actinacidiphila bryophytorum]
MRSRTPDRLCAEAVDVARAVTLEAAGPQSVGEHLGVAAEGDRVVTHFFACTEPAYRGWRWATTLTRASRAKVVTIDETVLLPGSDAVLAPEWVPWSERLRPGDMGPGDLLPTEADDLRLEPGWTGDDEPPAGEPGSEVEEDADMVVPSVATIGSIAGQLGMGRPRVLSRYGLHAAADRWDEQFGPKTAMAQAAPANCVSCGFLVPIAGSLSQAFGLCANEFSPADGRLVSLGYGCGGHSEAAVMPRPPQPAPMVLDELHDTDPLALHKAEQDGSAEPDGGPGGPAAQGGAEPAGAGEPSGDPAGS